VREGVVASLICLPKSWAICSLAALPQEAIVPVWIRAAGTWIRGSNSGVTDCTDPALSIHPCGKPLRGDGKSEGGADGLGRWHHSSFKNVKLDLNSELEVGWWIFRLPQKRVFDA
jgi:hypothetical protein